VPEVTEAHVSTVDPIGVLDGFAGGVIATGDAHLVLAGPSVSEVSDDPEGAETYEEVRRGWEALSEEARARVQSEFPGSRDLGQYGEICARLV
jgi:hypothetical protein